MTPTSAHGPIAVLAHRHAAVAAGGSEISAHVLFRGLKALGLPVVFIALADEANAHRIPPAEGEYLIPLDRTDADAFYHLGSTGSGARILRLLRKLGIQTLFAHHFLDIGVDTLRDIAHAGITTVLTLHEFLAICHNHGQMVTRPTGNLCSGATASDCATCFPERSAAQFSARRDQFHRAFSALHGFISPSAFLAGRYSDWGLPRERITVVENGLAVPPADVTPPPALSGGPVTVGYFGQITPFKGVQVLLQAAAHVAKDPDFAARIRIKVHGRVTYLNAQLDALLNPATPAEAAFSYEGPYDNSDVRRLMSACDFIAVPSIWWENSPLVIQEAFAAGRPVIGSALGGIAEKLAPHGGILFPTGDTMGLVGALRQAADTDLLSKLASRLPAPVSAEEMARGYLAALDHFAAQRRT